MCLSNQKTETRREKQPNTRWKWVAKRALVAVGTRLWDEQIPKMNFELHKKQTCHKQSCQTTTPTNKMATPTRSTQWNFSPSWDPVHSGHSDCSNWHQILVAHGSKHKLTRCCSRRSLTCHVGHCCWLNSRVCCNLLVTASKYCSIGFQKDSVCRGVCPTLVWKH